MRCRCFGLYLVLQQTFDTDAVGIDDIDPYFKELAWQDWKFGKPDHVLNGALETIETCKKMTENIETNKDILSIA